MKRITLPLVVATSLAASAHAGVIIAPVAGTINSGGPGFGTLTETFNQAGLFSGYTAGATDFDTYIGTNPQHSLVFSGNEWFSNSGSTSASVTYDLGSAVTIDAFALWNEDFSGIALFDLFGSSDGLIFSALALALSPTDTPNDTDYGPQVFNFSASALRYVRLDMLRCPQEPAGFDGCAIGEVAFRTAGDVAVPEPAALGLLGLGLLGLAAARRRTTR